MEKEPLLAISSSSSSSSSSSPRKKSFSFFSSPPPPPSSVLCPLPEDEEICLPPPTPLSSSLKDRLIFGPHPADVSDAVAVLNLIPSSTPPRSPLPLPLPPPPPPPPPTPSDESPSWLLDASLAINSSKTNLHRSRTAPAMSAINDVVGPQSKPRGGGGASSVVRQAVILLTVYLIFGVTIYTLCRRHFSVDETHPVVDALYFCIVTMCTIGYGDITPKTPYSKLFSISFVLVGFGFIDVLLSGMVSYVLDLQESLLLGAVVKARSNHRSSTSYIVDVKKGRMRIRMKVGLALGVVVLCIGVGTGVLRFVERLGWLDSFYLSVMSVTTVGYGDRAFKSLPGRLFASIWLLFSTLAVARAFLYLAEARIDKRHRQMLKTVLCRDMTISEFLAADMDNNGFVSKSEYVIYKLKEMGKITEKDISQICNQFERLDTGNCGKITLSDLIEGHH